MSDAELVLEIILNGIVDGNPSSVWAKNPKNSHQGWLYFSGSDKWYIVDVAMAKLVNIENVQADGAQ